MRTIRFKSIPVIWRKEYLGLKPNTLRTFEDSQDIRLEIIELWEKGKLNAINIEIENTETHEMFTRRVIDITFWKNEYIISWQHEIQIISNNKLFHQLVTLILM